MKEGAKEFISAELSMTFRVLRDTFRMKQDRAIKAVREVLDEISAVSKELNVMSYVLITTAPAKAGQVLEKVKKLPTIREAYVVTGIYDIIAALKTQDIKELKEVITGNIHRLSDIGSTATSIVVK